MLLPGWATSGPLYRPGPSCPWRGAHAARQVLQGAERAGERAAAQGPALAAVRGGRHCRLHLPVGPVHPGEGQPCPLRVRPVVSARLLRGPPLLRPALRATVQCPGCNTHGLQSRAPVTRRASAPASFFNMHSVCPGPLCSLNSWWVTSTKKRMMMSDAAREGRQAEGAQQRAAEALDNGHPKREHVCSLHCGSFPWARRTAVFVTSALA